jgi:recombination DNA repair RAD52 pathway protein
MKDFTQQQLQALMAPLNGNRVSSRSQGGRSLSYLEAWDVKAALIRVFGFGNWSADVVHSEIIRMERDVPAYAGSGNDRKRKTDADGNPDFNWSVAAMVTLRLTIHMTGATYTETAIASQTGPDVGEVADFAMKTAESDALKRCAINLGTQFGLGLYNNGSLADVVRVLLDPTQKGILERKEPDGPNEAPKSPDPVQTLIENAGARVVETDSGTYSGKDEFSPADENEG